MPRMLFQFGDQRDLAQEPLATQHGSEVRSQHLEHDRRASTPLRGQPPARWTVGNVARIVSKAATFASGTCTLGGPLQQSWVGSL